MSIRIGIGLKLAPGSSAPDPIPHNILAVWVDDYAQIDFTDRSGGVAQHEIWESVDGGAYSLVTTLAVGTTHYHNYTWQGASMNFKIRAKIGTTYSSFSAVVNLVTPLVVKIDQTPTTNYVSIGTWSTVGGGTFDFDWGDGNTNHYINGDLPSHDYAGLGSPAQDPYFIQVSGDLNKLSVIDFQGQPLIYGDISKWRVQNLISLTYLRTLGSTLSGDLSLWNLPTSLAKLYLSESGSPVAFTGVPRGELKQIEAATCGLWMYSASLSTAAMDSWLAYANAYFIANTPINNAIFEFRGAPNQAPTGGNLNADRVNIIALFTAAGFTATLRNVT